MGRTKPQTAVRKLICLGPRSGLVYPVEDFPEVGTLVVRAPNGRAIAQFIRAAMQQPGKPGLVYQNGQGDAELLELIRQDFAVESKLVAVPAPGSASSSATSSAASSASPPPKPTTKASTPSGI